MKRRFSTKGAQCDSPGQCPGFVINEELRALKGRHNRCFALSGLGMFLATELMALPWAGMYRPFGAATQSDEFAESMNLEQAVKVNHRGLGYGG